MCKEIASKYGGFGGGHSRACGMKISKEHLQAVLDEFDARLN
jgi:nanoRNase/pAp phosphatase (c-di-AMP/oligoRNAs hydrolase)